MPTRCNFAPVMLFCVLTVACQSVTQPKEKPNTNLRTSEQPSPVPTHSTTLVTPVETPVPKAQIQSNRKPTPNRVAKETPLVEAWCFWYEKKDKTGVKNERRGSEETCKDSLKNWQYDPIVFGCHKVTEGLLQEAAIACGQGKHYACSWHDDVKSLLEILKKN